MEKQNGVTFCVHKSEYWRFNACDMDVEPGIKRVQITMDIIMPDSKKSFPDVTELEISEEVSYIEIPNTLFPNVRKVISHSTSFMSDVEYLERCSNYTNSYVLLNTFCHSEEDVIDLNDVMMIDNYAFKDSECVNVVNVKRLSIINPKAFTGSCLDKQPYINGIKMAGPILVDVDKTADAIELPDDKVMIQHCMADFTGVKNVITHSTRTFTAGCIKTFPEMVTFDLVDKNQSINKLVASLHRFIDGTDRCITNISFTNNTKKNYNIKTVINIVYSKDEETLIACTEDIEHLVIPDGVKTIQKKAFYNCRFLKSVEIPDSVTEIRESAFENCVSLEKVRLSNNITEIQYKSFARCKFLRYIEIPKKVKQIDRYAFSDSGLEKINLNEGLELIGEGAFNLPNIRKMEIPSTVTGIGNWTLGENIEEIKMQTWFPEIIYPVIHSTHESNNQVMDAIYPFIHSDSEDNSQMLDTFTVECDEKKLILPKHIKKSWKNKLYKNVDAFMQSKESGISTFEYASASQCRENMAVEEVLEYKNENAKEFVKKNSRRISLRYVKEKDEERLSKLLLTGLVSKVTMRNLLNEISDDMVTARAYLVEAIGKEGKNKFSI